MNKTFFKIVVCATFVYFFSWFAVYKLGINKLAIQSEDTLPALFMPVTLIKEGTIYLDSVYDMLVAEYPDPRDRSGVRGLLPFYLRRITQTDEAHYVSAFTIITPLLVVPVYLLPVLAGMPITFETVTILGHLSAALIVALSGFFLFVLLRRHFLRDTVEKYSLLLTFICLFATINYAHISQALWQHGTIQLFTVLALLAIYERKWFLTGLCFGLMILSRPTGGIAVAFLGLLCVTRWVDLDNLDGDRISFRDRLKSISFLKSVFSKPAFLILLGVFPSIIFFWWYNRTFYGDVSNQGYASQVFTGWYGRFPEGFLGLWISPSKGILIYSPVLGFSLYGAYLAIKKWRHNVPYVLFFMTIITHTLVYGKWKHWFGGWSFGYRMASDVLPFFILLLVPVVLNFREFNCWPFKKIPVEVSTEKAHISVRGFYAVRLFWITIIFSVLVQFYGIALYDGMWHAAYDQGDINTAWLWSIKDSEIAFNIRRALLSAGVLKSAF